MTFGKGRDKTQIVVNRHLTLAGIPLEAYEFKVQGKSPIEWLMSRYVLKPDKDSGLINDPNEYTDDPKYLVEMLKRVISVSMDSLEPIDALPKLEILEGNS